MKVPNCKYGNYKEIKRKNSSSYIIVISLGWNNDTKRYERYTEVVGSEPEAIVALKEINEFLYFGGIKDKQNLAYFRKRKLQERKNKTSNRNKTFEQVANDFIKHREDTKKVSKRTISTYKENAKRALPYIGNIPIQNITAEMIDSMYEQMLSDGTKNLSGKPLSGTSVSKTHSLVNLVFTYAVNHDIIYKNPVSKVDKPKVDTKEKTCLSVQQAQMLFDYYSAHATEDPHNIGILLGLLSGLRLSEMLALTWADYVDGFFIISKSLEKDSAQIKSTKNGEKRTVAVPLILQNILDAWKKQQKQLFKSYSVHWTQSVPIVHSQACGTMMQCNFHRWIALERDRGHLPSFFTFHLLRHTYTTLIYRECGIDEKTTRELTGHRSATAFNIYIHSNDEWKIEAVSRLNDLIINKE